MLHEPRTLSTETQLGQIPLPRPNLLRRLGPEKLATCVVVIICCKTITHPLPTTAERDPSTGR